MLMPVVIVDPPDHASGARCGPIWSKMVIYGFADCVGCAEAGRLADALGVPFEVRDVGDPIRRAELEGLFRTCVLADTGTVPQIFWVDAVVHPAPAQYWIPLGGLAGARAYLASDQLIQFPPVRHNPDDKVR